MNAREKLQGMLTQDLPETEYQQFLENNREFLPTPFLHHHGILFGVLFKQFPLFENYRADFMYVTCTSVDVRIVLVEIEKPQSKIFKSGSLEFHSHYVGASDQIKNWKTELSIPARRAAFLSELGPFILNKTNPQFDFKYVLIHGRKAEYEGLEKHQSKLKMDLGADSMHLSYDSLLANEEHKFTYLATKNKGRINLIDYDSNPMLGDTIFNYVNPHVLSITPKIKTDLFGLIDAKKIPFTGQAIQIIYQEQAEEIKRKIDKVTVETFIK